MKDKTHYVYILASKRRGALYVGVATDLAESVLEHKANMIDGVTSLYAIHQLVYYEVFAALGPALLRQGQIRRLHRRLRLHLVEQMNPDWHDLYECIVADRSRLRKAIG